MITLPSRFLLCCLLLAGSRLASQDAASTGTEQRIASLLQATMAEHGIPGLSCAVVVGDEMKFSRGFGKADLENDVPATAATVYRLASISKPVTAVLAMQLAERGQLDIDADVHGIVRQWPEKKWPVTTRQLLAHLGGVRHYQGEGESTRRYRNQTAALGRFADDALLHEPGTLYRYSTYGFNLVAAVVEARTGNKFATLVRERIAGPCGAPTMQDDDLRRLIRGRAQGYVKRNGELENSELMDASYKLGGGGLCSSAPDLARFAQALMAGKLVAEPTLAEMWTEQKTVEGKPVGYGLGFRVAEVEGVRTISHSGAQSRVSTMLLMLPEQRIAVVVMCNLQRMRLAKVAQQIAFAVRKRSEGDKE